MQEANPILGWKNRGKRLWLLKFRSFKSCNLDFSIGGNFSAGPGISVHGRRAPVWGTWGPQVWVQGILRPPTSEEGHLLTGGTSLAPWILDKLLTLGGIATARERETCGWGTLGGREARPYGWWLQEPALESEWLFLHPAPLPAKSVKFP